MDCLLGRNVKTFAFLLLAAGLTLAADFQAGLAAYNKGDFATALKEWQPLAEQGDANSQYNLGLLYARGQGVAQDYKQAAAWYEKAANQGVPAAEYNLGVMYANGEGVPKSSEDAEKWFLKAAQKGVSDAASSLGTIYSEGEGAFKNYSEAEKWYRQAAEKGVASAAFNLGVMYDIGQGVPKDYKQAIEWYQKAADAGYPAAMTNLGILYYNAQGVKRDLIQAYCWFQRAQKGGDPRASELVTVAASKMRPGDIKKAQAQVDSWHPTNKPATVETAALFAPRQAQAQTAKPQPPQQDQKDQTQAQGTAERAAATAAETAPKSPAAATQQDVWTGVQRIIAVGDVHGDFEQFALILKSAGLIDDKGDWVGGTAHLVQTGDVVDRGPDSRAVMDLLMKLEKQAAAAGGGVHCLIGNHEAMDVYGDLRYVSPGEYSAFRTENSEAARATSYKQYHEAMTAASKPEMDRSEWELEHPPGFAEHREAFGPEGVYGKWIRGHNTIIKIDRTLFLHAGLGEKYEDWTLDRINDEVRKELNNFTELHGGVVTDEQGPLWYRGLATGDEKTLEPVVDALLKHFDVDRIVIGHSYARAAITPRFDGKVVLIDIGISRVYDNIGKVGALEIKDGKALAIHRGVELPLPTDEDGPSMLEYLKKAAALDPKPSPLEPRIEELEKNQH